MSTTASAPAAPAPSEPTADTTGTVESPGVGPAIVSEPTPDDTSAEDPGETEGTESEDDQPRSEEEKKLSRSERRRLREQERIDKAVADAIAASKREAEQAEEVRKNQERIQQAIKARQERLAKFVGTPESLQTLSTEIDTLNRQIRSELVDPKGADLDALADQVAQKEFERSRLQENQQYEGVIRDEIWTQIESDYAFPATFPELANDSKAKAAYLNNPQGIRGALTTLAETIRSSKDREWQAKLDAATRESDSKIKALEADRNGWRQRAGGGGDSVEEAGTPAYSAGTLTPERYAAMSSTDRAKLLSTVEGRNQIDAMMQRRSGAA